MDVSIIFALITTFGTRIVYVILSKLYLFVYKLWGFDLFLFLVSGAIAITHIKKRQSMTVWAYVFPVGVSTFADI